MSGKSGISWQPQLILFSLFLLIGCVKKQEVSQVNSTILWKNGQAIGLAIPLQQLSAVSKASVSTLITVQRANAGAQTAILGEYTVQKDTLIFEPLIPFTAGLRYRVLLENTVLSELEIPRATHSPELTGIYPSQDTLPENLLKFYFVFSGPMTEGHSLQYIALLDAKGDTLLNTFLKVHPELWNAERTVLTVWLDPGRIKRDLQPNKLLGTPLTQGRRYTLCVSNQWPDQQGALLMKTYSKAFVAAARDIASPKVAHWKLTLPQKSTVQPLSITVPEALDYVLLHNTVQVVDTQGNTVAGSFQISDEEKKIRFMPTKPWSAGTYKLQVEARLEDLAGNNLNRLFDRDITDKKTLPSDQKVFELPWHID